MEFSEFDSALFVAAPVRAATVSSGPQAYHPHRGYVNHIGEGTKYPVYLPPGRYDPWVWQALKNYDRPLYTSLKGQTRMGEGIRGMYTSLQGYDHPPVHRPRGKERSRIAMDLAISDAHKAFTLPTAPSKLSLKEAVNTLEKTTSAGSTFPKLKKGDCLPQIYLEARRIRHFMKQAKDDFNPTKARLPVCMAATRGGLSPLTEPKTRLVWVYPAEIIAIEQQYARPLYDALAALPASPMLYGGHPDDIVERWFHRARHGGEFYVGMDISSFDQTAPNFLIKEAFDCFFNNLNPLSAHRGEDKSPIVAERKMMSQRDALCWYFINTPICLPDGRVWRKHTGVPSGSAFTQLVDSFVNYVYLKYTGYMQGVKIQELIVLGDDSAFRTNNYNLAAASNDLLQNLGVTVNETKSQVTNKKGDLKLLGFTYPNGHRYRPDRDWFAQALYPESPVRTLSDSFGRLFGLWLAGAKHCEHFCRFIVHYQSGYPVPESGSIPLDTRRYLNKVLGLTVASVITYRKRAFLGEYWSA